MHKFDLAAILTIIVGIGAVGTSAGFSGQLTVLFGPHAPGILAALGILATIASSVLRVISNPSPPAGTTPVLQPTAAAGAAPEKAP